MAEARWKVRDRKKPWPKHVSHYEERLNAPAQFLILKNKHLKPGTKFDDVMIEHATHQDLVGNTK